MRGLLRLKKMTSQDGQGHRRGGGVREATGSFIRSLVKSLPETLLKVWAETHYNVRSGKIINNFQLLYTFCMFQIFYCKCMTFTTREKTIIIFKITTQHLLQSAESL